MENSPDLLIKVPDLQGTLEFFKNSLGLEVEKYGEIYLVKTQHYNIFLEEDEEYSITFEFLTENYDLDRERLIDSDCDPVATEVEIQKDWLQHKSGFLFNLYAKNS